jgi:hypothetical protein
MTIHFESTGSLTRHVQLDMKFSTISEVVCDEELAAGIKALRAWGGLHGHGQGARS